MVDATAVVLDPTAAPPPPGDGPTPTPVPRRRRGGKGRGLLFWSAGAWLGFVVFVAVTASWLPLADPEDQNLRNKLALPGSPGHLLGTDGLGRDILARLVFGARVSL